MPTSINISPSNSLLFLSDEDGGKAPTPVWGAQILATSSCISFVCYPAQDGPTQVTLGPASEVDPGYEAAFKGDLETPHRTLIVSTVELETVLKSKVPSIRTHIRIWLSHPRWPEQIFIGFE